MATGLSFMVFDELIRDGGYRSPRESSDRNSPICEHHIIDIDPRVLVSAEALWVCDKGKKVLFIDIVECTLDKKLLKHGLI